MGIKRWRLLCLDYTLAPLTPMVVYRECSATNRAVDMAAEPRYANLVSEDVIRGAKR